MSPLLRVISESKGGQTFYGAISVCLLILLAFKLVLVVISPEERLSCIQFFGGEFYPIKYFLHLFIVHHLILYSVVYPAGKYLKHNAFILKCTGLIAMALCKWAIYSLVYVKTDSTATIRCACSFENVRVMMMCISFLCESHKLQS